jgi:hypothetical protein
MRVEIHLTLQINYGCHEVDFHKTRSSLMVVFVEILHQFQESPTHTLFNIIGQWRMDGR